MTSVAPSVCARRAILILSFLGVGAFSSALLLSYMNPLLVERAAREAVRIEVQERVEDKLQSLCVRKRADLQLLLPALAIVGAVLLAGGFYLFKQDWLHAILFGDYVGLGYAAWLASVALLLADILMNRARITTRLVDLALNAAGAAASAAPC